jgi:hypothetical protein
MLVATILGVWLIPVLFVTVERVIGRGKHAAPPGGASPAEAPGTGGH